MIKKAFIPLAIFISGCSSVPIDETYSIFRATLAGFTNQSISAEDYDKSPFSFIQVKIGNASPAPTYSPTQTPTPTNQPTQTPSYSYSNNMD